MISYSWAQQTTVETFVTHLKKSQGQGDDDDRYDIWIDLEQMAGDTVKAMASAVENAKVIIMCISKEYKESHNC